jgi:hypothetical protein
MVEAPSDFQLRPAVYPTHVCVQELNGTCVSPNTNPEGVIWRFETDSMRSLRVIHHQLKPSMVVTVALVGAELLVFFSPLSICCWAGG